jgi:hypothetical protein
LKTLINHAGGFEEYLTITPIEFDMFEVKVQSKYADSKDPDALQTRYQGFVSIQALHQLHDDLSSFLF